MAYPTHEQGKDCCYECVWFHYPNGGKPKIFLSFVEGECRASSPIVGGRNSGGIFPIMKSEDWCGDYQTNDMRGT